MSLRTALGFVGGAIGFVLGGPGGARWGFMIGSTIGSIVDPGTVKGPSIGEIANQTSQEGGPRPIVFVRSPPMPGNIIDQSAPRIVKSKSGGKGGPKVVSEQVFRTYAIGVCEGPVAGFRRIWRNNVLVYDVSDDSQLSDDDNAAFLTKARLFLGTFDQDASPDLEAIHGAGNTPAYRGTAYMVMADEDLTSFQGAIPQWQFEVATGCAFERVAFTDTGQFMNTGDWIRPDGIERINLFLVGPGGPGGVVGGTGPNGAGGGGGGGQILYEQEVDVSGHDHWRIQIDRRDLYFAQEPSAPTKFGWYNSGDDTFHPIREALAGGNGRQYNDGNHGDGASGGGGGRALTIGTEMIPGGYCDDPISSTPVITDNTDYPPGSPTAPAQYGGGNSSWNHNACIQFSAYGTTGGGGGGAGGPGQDASPVGAGIGGLGKYYGHLVGTDLGKNGYFSGGGGGGSSGSNWDVRLPVPEGDNARIAQGGLGLHGGGNGAGYNFPDGNVTDGATPGFPTSGGGGGGGMTGNPEFPGEWGGSGVGVILFCPGGTAAESLKTVVTAICARAGLPESKIDVTLLPEVDVEGMMITNQYAAVEALRSLGQVYFFDISPRDGKVWFIPRGGNSIGTITEGEMVDDDREIEDTMRDDSISVPRALHLNYWDVAGGLATSKQTSERAGDRRSVGEASIQSPVLMTADQAARVVVVNHKVMAENQKGTVNFALPDSRIALTTADPIIVPVTEVNRRLRIEKLEIMDGFQNYECAYDRQSAYTSNVQGIPPAPSTPPPSSIVGPTLLVPLDIKILRDGDDSIGLSYYVAVSGLRPAWTGALVELSLDGGATYIDSQSATAAAVMGELVSVLGSHPAEFPDHHNTANVRIDTPLGELEETTLAGMLNRLNLAAIGTPEGSAAPWELVNFSDSEETTEGEWTLGTWLRGRKGTQSREHSIGEKFVLLERALLGFIPAGVALLGKTLTFRATSFGASTDTGTVVTMLYGGASQTEREIGYLSARRDGTNAIIEWQGIGRLGAGSSAIQGAYFDGYRVTIDDGVNPSIVVDTAAETLTHDVSSLGSPLTISVTQRNTLTGDGPATEVILT